MTRYRWRWSETPAITLTLVALATTVFVPDTLLQRVLFGLTLVVALLLGLYSNYAPGRGEWKLHTSGAQAAPAAETEKEREIMLTWREAMRPPLIDER